MELELFLGKEKYKYGMEFHGSSPNHVKLKAYVHGSWVRAMNYCFYLDTPLKMVLKITEGGDLKLKGFKKQAHSILENAYFAVKNIKTDTVFEYAKIDVAYKMSNSTNVYLLKYQKVWYIVQNPTFIEEPLVKDWITVASDKDLESTNNQSIYKLHGTNNHLMSKTCKYAELDTVKLFRIHDSCSNTHNKIPTSVTSISDDFYRVKGGTYFHKSLDGKTPLVYKSLFSKEELLEKRSNCTELNRMFTEKCTKVFGINPNQSPSGIINSYFKDRLFMQNYGSTCMDFVKQNERKTYYIPRCIPEYCSYTKDEVFEWYDIIMKMFEGVYSKEDISLELVEAKENELAYLHWFLGAETQYYKISMSSNVKAYHNYLFAILFRYLYFQYDFPVKLKKLMAKKEIGLWEALKIFHIDLYKNNLHPNHWDISYTGKGAPHPDLTFKSYLDKLHKYETAEGRGEFTKLITTL